MIEDASVTNATLNISANNVNVYDVKLNRVTMRDGNLCNLPIYSDEIDTVEYVSMLTGVNAQLDSTKYGIDGTDLGIIYYDSTKNQMRYLFGDTFSDVKEDGTLTGNWRSQTVGITSDFDASDGIKLDTYLSNEETAKHIIPGKHDKNAGEITKIPTGGIEINGNHYVFFMSIREWFKGGWSVNYCGLLKSVDGNNFTLINNVYFCNSDATSISNTKNDLGVSDVSSNLNANFMQVFPFENEGYIYLYGIPEGRHEAIKVARVLKEQFEDMDEYEYHTDNGWIKRSEGLTQSNNSSATSLPNVGELSVIYNSYLQKYIMTYVNVVKGGIAYQTSDDLVHWSNEQIIAKSTEFHSMYGAFTHKLLTEDDGKTMYFTMSQYAGEIVHQQIGEDQYNVKIMKMVFR